MTEPPAGPVSRIAQTALNVGLMTLGASICAVGINGILVPQRFVSGGVVGLALLIHYNLPALPVGLLYLALNLPLFAYGWTYVGRRFLLYSLAGMLIFSAGVAWIRVPVPLEDRMLGALLAGIIIGTGAGITLRSLGSAGGTDILSVILMKRFSIRVGSTGLAFNAGVLVLAAFSFSLENVLYTLVYMYVASRFMNLVVVGLSQRRAVHIISEQWREIRRGILEEMDRGATLLKAEGAYTGRELPVIYTVITFPELARLKEIIRRVDPSAFVVVSDTAEVMGLRIGNQPRW